MAKTTKLSDRMKRYEAVTNNELTLKVPAVLRLDGCHFHTFTRGLKKPFDDILMSCMQKTMQSLCEDIQGCIMGYTQSDEISLILIDYQTKDTAAWFDYRVQKCATVAASKATKYFNRYFSEAVEKYYENYMDAWNTSKEDEKYVQTLMKARDMGAEFDARIFNIPKDEVCNYLFWRQDDASRNSIQMVGHAYFSDKEMQKKSNEQIQEMLWSRHNINWNNLPIPQKRGTCCIKIETEMERNGEKFMRKKWTLDKEIPIFTGDGREYVEKHIFLD